VKPVLIVGAGPVGLAGALLLARHGVPSTVLESTPARQTVGSRSICVQRDVLDILQRVGLGWTVVGAGVTWYTGRIYYKGREVFTITFPETGPGEFPPFVNISQRDVEALLEKQVAATPLIDLRYGHVVDALTVADESVTVRVSTQDGVREFVGTHCIAADGPRSTVRELLGLPFPGHSFDDQFLITDIRAELDFPVPERRFYFDPPANPGRQVLLHPQPDSVWRIDWQVSEGFDLAADRSGGGLDRRMRAILGDTSYEAMWLSVYRFHQRRVPDIRLGRVLLAGDAAHLMSPFGARGMNSGIADVENAAWKIALDRAGAGGPNLLASYDHERGAAAEENLRVTAETMRFLVPRTESERARRRDILERSLTEPAARVRIDSGKLSEPFWYLDSPLTTPADPAALAGFPTAAGMPRPPVPGVLCPDLPTPKGRLRDRLASGFTVLAGAKAETDLGALRLPVHVVTGKVAATLGFGDRGAALVRPDGYLAAISPGGDLAEHIAVAHRRACGW
jgi:2-polyprenyl-6-methoxyphenol hydroxylase-like FAD-dependent oxidoreductase